MRWNEYEHTDEENLKWSWLRAVEWGAFPIFVTQPIIPFLIFFFDWKIIIGVIIICNWLWNFIRYRYTNLSISTTAALFVSIFKWISCMGFGIYFLIHKDYFLAALSGLYPFWSGIVGGINIPSQIGIIQQKFMRQLGYEKVSREKGGDGQYYRLEIIDRLKRAAEKTTNPTSPE